MKVDEMCKIIGEIRVTPVRNYGRVEYAPYCTFAHLFCRLLGQKHLTGVNVETIKELGIVVRIAQTNGGVL